VKSYPIELRTRIVDAVDRGLGSVPAIAARFSVSITCVTNYLQLREQTGSLQPRPNAGGRAPAIPEDRYPELRQILQEQPDLTLDQIRERLQVSCSLAALCRTLQKLQLTRKKKVLRAAEQQRPDVQAARDEWAQWQAQLTAEELKRLVFWDETAVLTNMTLLYGRSPPGERIIESVPQGHWERLTLAGGVRLSGLCGALLYEGGTTVEACAAFAVHELGPALQPGDVVILDNLSSHEHPSVVEALQALGVTVKPLPPYSPDLNPIEKMWSKTKQGVRRLRPRTTADLIAAVGQALRTITQEDIRGWFEHCGYHTDS
jgi:transposase